MRGLLRTSFPTSNRIKEHILNFDHHFLSTHYQWIEQVWFLSCFKRAFACASPHCVNKCHRNTFKTMLIGVIETHREKDRSIAQISLSRCLRRLCRLPRLCRWNKCRVAKQLPSRVLSIVWPSTAVSSSAEVIDSDQTNHRTWNMEPGNSCIWLDSTFKFYSQLIESRILKCDFYKINKVWPHIFCGNEKSGKSLILKPLEKCCCNTYNSYLETSDMNIYSMLAFTWSLNWRR